MSTSPESPRSRRLRIAELDPTDGTDLFALRDAIVTDADAEVRALAAHRLGATSAHKLVTYLRDATRDASPLVREAAFVAWGRARDADCLPQARLACSHDRSFRVRRAALLCAARACGSNAQDVIAISARDPFWRVRAAARRAAEVVAVAIQVGSDSDPGVRGIPALEDPDPAVVTVELRHLRTAINPDDLVGLLGHPHQPLRRLALKEIAARGSLRTLRAASRWLIDGRVPYAPSATEAALNRSRLRGTLAEALLDEELAAGPLAWAVEASPTPPPWGKMEAFLRHEDVRVRRAAVRRLPQAAPDRHTLFSSMGRLLEDADEETQIRAATWLANTRSHEACSRLRECSWQACASEVRMLVVEMLIGDGCVEGLRAFVHDKHGAVRASALSALSRFDALTRNERADLAQDPDPWIRRAVLSADHAWSALRDPCPEVRLAAVQALPTPALRLAWARDVSAESEPKPGLRSQAAVALREADSDDATRALLRFARDRDLGVRSVAVDALAMRSESVRRLLSAGALELGERLAAYTLLRTEPGDEVAKEERASEALEHLALLRATRNGTLPVLAVGPAERTRPRSPHSRQLGRTGLAAHPFGISGAYALSFDDLVLAHGRGVNLYFWEPTQRELGRFLRSSFGRDAVVVAGTYHADAVSIERDVARACRLLDRKRIDVFLAFWTRSSARIDHVAAVFGSLRERGLVGATGISTHDRSLACEAASRSFDVVMVRHSAAHRGAESTAFPHCQACGTGVLTFSNLCYGRMLHKTNVPLSAPVTPSECYRYSLSQPGVHACIAAPRRRSELLEDLAVVADPVLSAERQEELQAHGKEVYLRSKAWNQEARGPGGEPPSRSESVDVLEEWESEVAPNGGRVQALSHAAL